MYTLIEIGDVLVVASREDVRVMYDRRSDQSIVMGHTAQGCVHLRGVSQSSEYERVRRCLLVAGQVFGSRLSVPITLLSAQMADDGFVNFTPPDRIGFCPHYFNAAQMPVVKTAAGHIISSGARPPPMQLLVYMSAGQLSRLHELVSTGTRSSGNMHVLMFSHGRYEIVTCIDRHDNSNVDTGMASSFRYRINDGPTAGGNNGVMLTVHASSDSITLTPSGGAIVSFSWADISEMDGVQTEVTYRPGVDGYPLAPNTLMAATGSLATALRRFNSPIDIVTDVTPLDRRAPVLPRSALVGDMSHRPPVRTHSLLAQPQQSIDDIALEQRESDEDLLASRTEAPTIQQQLRDTMHIHRQSVQRNTIVDRTDSPYRSPHQQAAAQQPAADLLDAEMRRLAARRDMMRMQQADRDAQRPVERAAEIADRDRRLQELQRRPLVQVINQDITTLAVDAIVNAANAAGLGGSGVDGMIHAAAGPGLLAECRGLGGIREGEAKITSGHSLPARFVIHTVGPIIPPGQRPSEQHKRTLSSCYVQSLHQAAAHGVRSIAFPSISTGVYRYPIADAVHVAMSSVSSYLRQHRAAFDKVIFCTHSDRDYELYESTMPQYFRQV